MVATTHFLTKLTVFNPTESLCNKWKMQKEGLWISPKGCPDRQTSNQYHQNCRYKENPLRNEQSRRTSHGRDTCSLPRVRLRCRLKRPCPHTISDPRPDAGLEKRAQHDWLAVAHYNPQETRDECGKRSGHPPIWPRE